MRIGMFWKAGGLKRLVVIVQSGSRVDQLLLDSQKYAPWKWVLEGCEQ